MLPQKNLPYHLTIILLLFFASCAHRQSGQNADIIWHGSSQIPIKEARAIFDEGIHFVEQGDYGNARRCFSKANRECPNIPIVLDALGNISAKTGDPEKGITYYARALNIDSDFVNSYTNWGSALDIILQFEQAKGIARLGLARPSFDKYDRASLFYSLASTYFLEKQYDSALIFIDSAKRNSGHGRIYDLATKTEIQVKSKMSLPAGK